MLAQLSAKHTRAPNSSDEGLGKAGTSSQERTVFQGKKEGEAEETSEQRRDRASPAHLPLLLCRSLAYGLCFDRHEITSRSFLITVNSLRAAVSFIDTYAEELGDHRSPGKQIIIDISKLVSIGV